MKDRIRLPDEVRARGAVPAVEIKGGLCEPRRFGFELRRDTTPSTSRLVGYATTFDQPYDVYGGPSAWGWSEVVDAGAFDTTLRERDDVRLLFDHRGIPLARTKSETLTLSADEVGLLVDAELSHESQLASDVIDAVRRGDLDQMSIAFEVIRQSWSKDYAERRILEAKLWDVSVVTYPANEATMVMAAGAPREDEHRAAMGVRLARARVAKDRMTGVKITGR